MMTKFLCLKDLQAPLIGFASIVAAYFDSTITFVFALLLAFFFNILAGMRADEVKFTMWRVVNFKGHKFKDSLSELSLIVFVTYFIKAIIDLMQYNEKSAYAVQILIWLALYYYVRNSLRNLSTAYPKNKWIKVVYFLFSFQFRELMPATVGRAIDEANKTDKLQDDDSTNR